VSEVRIAAETRTEFGKGAARRVRRANRVPVVLYGHGDAPRHFSLPGHELMLALKHDANVLLTLQTDDGEQLALPKVVVKDPIKGFLEHVDLVAVRAGEKVSVDVAVTLTGDPAPDTLVDQQATTITVLAEATHLPEGLEVDITGLAAGEARTAADVPLPAGVTLAQDADAVVVHGLAQVSEAELELELAEAAAPAELSTEAGSESDKEGEGDVVGETEAPKSETPAQ
jgi:large subunit ribosomal protein L25